MAIKRAAWASYFNRYIGPRSTYQLLSWALIIVLLGCRVHLWQFKHDVDQPVRNDAAANLWVDVADRGEREKFYWGFFARGVHATDGVAVLATNHIVEKRLGFWVNKIDHNLRKQYPEKFRNIPSPHVRVVWNDEPNAYSIGVPTCLKVPVRFLASHHSDQDKISAHDESTLSTVFLDLTGVFTPWDDQLCIEDALTSVKAAEALVTSLNETMISCRLAVVKNPDSSFYLQAHQNCRKEFPVANSSEITRAHNMVILKTSNIIVLHTGSLTVFNEEHIVPVLAHELAHYYRAHAVLSPDDPRYNYFYQVYKKGENHGHKPIPTKDPELIKLGNTLLNQPYIALKYRRVPQQKWPSEFFIPMVQVARWGMRQESKNKNCHNGNEHCPCWQYVDWFDQPQVKLELQGFPYHALSKKAEDLYYDHEKRVGLCLAQLQVRDVAKIMKESARDQGVEWFFQFDEELFKHFFKDRINEQLQGLLAQNLDLTMLSFFQEYKVIFLAQWQSYLEPFRKAVELRLGYYTEEQEADELALEWLSQLSWLKNAVVESCFRVANFYQKLHEAFGHVVDPYPGDIPLGLCQEYYENDWKNEYGEPIFIPVGNYHDLHHAQCYRAYNLSAEIKAHNYSLPSDPAIFRQKYLLDHWQQLVEQFKALKDQAIIYQPYQVKEGMVKTSIKYFMNNKCPYARDPGP